MVRDRGGVLRTAIGEEVFEGARQSASDLAHDLEGPAREAAETSAGLGNWSLGHSRSLRSELAAFGSRLGYARRVVMLRDTARS